MKVPPVCVDSMKFLFSLRLFGSGTFRVLFGALAIAVTLINLPLAAADPTGSAGSSGSAGSMDGGSFSAPLPMPRGPGTAVVVLGYGLLPDGAMRPELVERLRAGYVQAVLAPASPIIVSGGNPHNGVTEASAMADWFICHGIPEYRVHLDHDAESTIDNADNSARIIREIGAQDAVVVTSANHVVRAVRNFREAGVNVVGAVTPEQASRVAWLLAT
ncbi:YdcF family protein [Nocardia sp. KC 131]|uniref:YdcF family protein n=1 Tax=Nocardia arseniciresistens TaxID=3392119 RepID=UPI00398E6AAB